MTLRIKGITSIAQLNTKLGTHIGNKLIDKDNEYKGDKYYKAKAYTVHGYFENGGKWYAAIIINKGILVDIKDYKTNNWKIGEYLK